MKMDFDLCNLFEEVDDHSNGLEYMETLDQPFAEHSSQQHLPTLSSSPVFDRQEGTNWLSFEDDLALYHDGPRYFMMTTHMILLFLMMVLQMLLCCF